MLNQIKDICGFLLALIRFIVFFGIILPFLLFGGAVLMLFKINTDKLIALGWKLIGFVYGLKIVKENDIPINKNYVYISNHISYWDMIVYGNLLNPSYISRTDVKYWPLIGFIADKFAKCYFIDRRPSQASNERKKIAEFMKTTTKPLQFMPEGTTSDGSHFLPIKGALFENFVGQDINVCLLRLKFYKVDGKLIRTKEQRRIHAWYNDPDPRYEDPSFFKHIFSSSSYKTVEVHVKCLDVINMKNIKSRHDAVDIITKDLEQDFKSEK